MKCNTLKMQYEKMTLNKANIFLSVKALKPWALSDQLEGLSVLMCLFVLHSSS